MPLDNHLTEIMKQKTKTELVQIIINKGEGMEPGSLLAAKNELRNRKMTASEFNSIRDTPGNINTGNGAKPVDFYESKADEPLKFYWIVLMFIFPGVLGLIMAIVFKMEGHERKFRSAAIWCIVSIAFTIAAAMLLAHFD